MKLWRETANTLEMIKWQHSIFALPFALTGAMLAAGGWPRASQLFWIVVCMVLARTAGMSFNRWADAALDADNARTSMRAIPGGLLTRAFVGRFTIAASILFLLAASQLNRLTFVLAPAELIVFGLFLYQAVYSMVDLVLDSPSEPRLPLPGLLSGALLIRAFWSLPPLFCVGWGDLIRYTPARTRSMTAASACAASQRPSAFRAHSCLPADCTSS